MTVSHYPPSTLSHLKTHCTSSLLWESRGYLLVYVCWLCVPRATCPHFYHGPLNSLLLGPLHYNSLEIGTVPFFFSLDSHHIIDTQKIFVGGMVVIAEFLYRKDLVVSI